VANPQKASSTYAPGMPVRNFGDLTGEKYIEERLNDQLRYYDKAATKGKRRYLQSRFVSVVAAALVPVFVNLKFPYVDVVTTVLSVLVVLIVSLESVFHFREQWVNSRSTSEALRKEYFQFTASEGRYADLSEDPQKAFRLFVGRVEAMIEAENLSTLQVMTRESRQEDGAAVQSVDAKSQKPSQ
jgi:hypothetical protein